MKCKYCDAELEADTKLCPSCGAQVEASAEETPVEAAAEETTEQAVEAPAEEITEPVQEETAEQPAEAEKPKKKKKVSWQTIVAIVASAVALVSLALVLLTAFGVNIFGTGKEEETENVGSFVSDVDYTGTEKQVKKAADKVVATMNGVELTNKQLQIYYSMLVTDFVSNYYSYLEQLGLDITLDLNTQACYYDDTVSWEQYFVDTAITTWQNRLAVCMLAEEEGHVLSDEMQAALDKMPEELQTVAEEAGFETVDELISDRIGINSTVEDYVEYSRIYYIGAEYTSILPSDEELSEYFDSLSEMFSEYGITKESGPMVDVRHILISPEGGTTDDSGNTTYTEEEWKACLEEAEKLLQEWKDGGATEDSFAELANTYSEDTGSNTNGGLYSGVTSETSFVEPFLTWCMDESRAVGDTGIVKTDYGYHIMYFSASEEQWLYYAKSQYISDRTTQVMEEGVAKWPIEINSDNICLMSVDFA